MAAKRKIKRRSQKTRRLQKYGWEIITRDGGFFPVNKRLFNILASCDEVCFLIQLMDLQRYWSTKKKLRSGGYFYATYDNLNRALNISIYKQRKIVKKLRDELGLIKTKEMRGKQYFRINRRKLARMLVSTPLPTHIGFVKIKKDIFH